MTLSALGSVVTQKLQYGEKICHRNEK